MDKNNEYTKIFFSPPPPPNAHFGVHVFSMTGIVKGEIRSNSANASICTCQTYCKCFIHETTVATREHFS